MQTDPFVCEKGNAEKGELFQQEESSGKDVTSSRPIIEKLTVS
jgi:hypothetical protein